MNTVIRKAVVCSLFNAKSAELKGKPLSAEKFDNGAMRDTSSCLMKYEVYVERNVRRLEEVKVIIMFKMYLIVYIRQRYFTEVITMTKARSEREIRINNK